MTRKSRLSYELLDFVLKKGKVREKDLKEAFVKSGKYASNTFYRYKKLLEAEGKLKKKTEEIDGRPVSLYYVPEVFRWDLETRKMLYSVGDLRLEFISWYGTGERPYEFTVNDVTCEYEEKSLPLPDELRSVKEEIIKEKMKDAREKGYAFDNNPHYKLLVFQPCREFLEEKKDRKHKVHLTFGPTDFYTCVATNLSLNKHLPRNKQDRLITIKDKYVKTQNLGDPTYLQNSPLANSFGIALATITEDDKILLQKRSQQVALGPGKLTVATAEMMLRERDIDKNGRPSPFETARRCVKTELGIEIKPEDVVFLLFGVRLDYALPQALGILKLKIRSDELPTLQRAINRWEGFNFPEEFSLNALKKYLLEPRKHHFISDTAKLTIILALINQYGFEKVKTHFLHY